MPPSIIRFKEVTGRTGSDNQDTDHRYTRVFQVVTDDFVLGPGWLLAQPEVAALGSAYEERDAAGNVVFTDAESVLVERRPEQSNADAPNVWQLVYEYVGVNDPEAVPRDVEWSGVRYQKALIKDLSAPAGKPVVNKAGDPFREGMQVDRTRGKVVITQNVVTWDPVAMGAFRDTTNAVPFLAGSHPPGFPIGTAKIVDIGATRIRRSSNTSFYWKRRVEVEVTLEKDAAGAYVGWNSRFRNAGFNELTDFVLGVASRKVPIVIAGGPPATEYPLDDDGRRLPLGGTPTELEFVGYFAADWTTLNLDY